MANNLTSNPLFIDTAAGAVTGMKFVLGIAWLGTEAANKDIAANDDFAVTTSAGAVIVEKRAAAAGDDLAIMFPKAVPFEGLIVSKLDGGVCFIYLE
jgi:hypothetical protein